MKLCVSCGDINVYKERLCAPCFERNKRRVQRHNELTAMREAVNIMNSK